MIARPRHVPHMHPLDTMQFQQHPCTQGEHATAVTRAPQVQAPVSRDLNTGAKLHPPRILASSTTNPAVPTERPQPSLAITPPSGPSRARGLLATTAATRTPGAPTQTRTAGSAGPLHTGGTHEANTHTCCDCQADLQDCPVTPQSTCSRSRPHGSRARRSRVRSVWYARARPRWYDTVRPRARA